MCFLAAGVLAAGATATTTAATGMSVMAQMGLALSALSAGTSIYGQYQQGKQAERVGEINQEQANIEAGMIKEQGLDRAQAIRQQTRQTMARQTAETAASGGQTTAGSPLDILKDTARIGATDEARSLTNTDRMVLSKLNEGRQSAAQGKFGRYSSRLKMTGTALSGAGQVADKWYRYTDS